MFELKHYLIAYFSTVIVFLAIDALWLGVIAKNFYFQSLEHLMLDQVKLHIAALFYLFYAMGIVFFAIKPGFEAQSLLTAFLHGAFLGFLAYGTYDFTNMATLKDWPLKMSIVDIVWGSVLTGISASAGLFILTKFSS